MKLPEFAVSHPITVTMAVLIALLLGFVSLSKLAVDLFPELNFPAAAVATSYEGAGPNEVETLVSRPLEEVLTTTGNVKNVSSTSTRGQSLVIVEFNWGTDMDFAALDMREKVDLIKPTLPDGVASPRVLKFDPASSPVLQIGMGGARDLAELKELAEDTVKSRLERIEGVASVRVTGGREPQVHIVLDPSLMRTLGVSFEGVVQGLQAANLNLPGGRIETGVQEVTIRTTGEFTSLSDLGQVRIQTLTGGVFLRDVATIRMDESDVEQLTRLNGRPSIGLDILKETGSNTVQVARRVHREIDRLEADLGGDVEFVTVADPSEFIEGSIQSVRDNTIMGGILAMAVLFLFLRNVRTTAIIGTAIPISVIFTFVLVYFSGMTLNMMSLGGLALGVGMLVDNSIVVLENIYRHRQVGENPREAAQRGTSEVGLAIVASTLTTVAVFLPVVFIDGLASQIFQDLSLTVVFSLLASLAVSFTLVPMLASRWLTRPQTPAFLSDQASSLDEQPRGLVARLFEQLAKRYALLLEKVLARKRWVFLTVIAVFIVSVFLAPGIGLEFMPASDEGQIRIDVEMPKGTRLDETDRVVGEIERYVAGLPDAASVFATAGSADAPDEGSLNIHLVPAEIRRRSTQAVIETIRLQTGDLPGAEVRVSASSGFAGGGFGGAPVQVELRGNNLDQLEAVAQDVAALVRAVPGTRDVVTSNEVSRPEVQVRVDREKAGKLGLSVAQIASAVRTAIKGQVATVFRTDDDEIDVLVRLDEEARRDLSDLHQVPIGTPFGIVPLGEVAELRQAESPVAIDRSSQVRVVAVSAQLAGRDLGSVMADIRSRLGDADLPPTVEVGFGGEDQQMMEAFADLGLALVLAILLVYAVMASQFESVIQPLGILLSVPFAFIGVLWSLFLSGYSLSVPALVGVIMLAGIVVNNAIVLLDFVNQLRDQGKERTEALIEGARTRLRPILMTTLTSILGMVPLALGIGEGSEIQAPIAIVVIGGLTASTLLTLIVVPALYAVLDDFSAWLRRLFTKEKEHTRGVVT